MKGTNSALKSGMCERVALRRVLLAVLLLTCASCSDDDDGGGPTGPPAPVPRIAGNWSGIFSSDNGDSVAIFDLQQNGRNVSGVVSVGGVAWPLEGEVNTQGFFRWQTGSGTCGSFNGTANLTSATHLSGSADLERFFCPEQQRGRGTLELNLDRPR